MIPRIMHQIWIGPHDPPTLWLNSWRDSHPNWQYVLWTNRDLFDSFFGWSNPRHMMHYWAKRQYAGVADIMRYDILHRFGGVVVAADSVCLHPIDELFNDGHSLYTISTHYEGNRSPLNVGAVTPLYAATPQHSFVATLIKAIHNTRRHCLGTPVRTTGNRFMQRMLKLRHPYIKIWPMHYFIPEHFNGWKYDGPDRIYAKHFWGTTRNTYAQGRTAK